MLRVLILKRYIVFNDLFIMRRVESAGLKARHCFHLTCLRGGESCLRELKSEWHLDSAALSTARRSEAMGFKFMLSIMTGNCPTK